MTTLHDFTMTDIDGSDVDLSDWADKVVLAVNVASECGYTPQYEGLERLWKNYRDDGLIVAGFPANNFGGQEPGSEEQIKSFCTRNFGVTFPMFSKISVKGDDQHPLYDFLTEESGDPVSWNFNKFLIDGDGQLIAHYASDIEPMSQQLTEAIEDALGI